MSRPLPFVRLLTSKAIRRQPNANMKTNNSKTGRVRTLANGREKSINPIGKAKRKNLLLRYTVDKIQRTPHEK